MSATYLDEDLELVMPLDLAQSLIKDALGWESAPEGAKEFTVSFSGGLVRRPALILKNAAGKYSHIAIYKSKKDLAPMAEIEAGHLYRDYVDIAFKGDKQFTTNRIIKLMHLEEDGSAVRMYVSAAMDIDCKAFYHPAELYDIIKNNIGYIPPTSSIYLQDAELHDAMLDCWDIIVDWQARAIQYMVDHEGIEAVFSHLHNVDICDHTFIRYMKDKGLSKFPPEVYEQWMETLYVQTDRYIGEFLKYLDQGWTIFIVSDHALICPEYQCVPLGDMLGVNVLLMEELGYSKFLRNADGVITGVDWPHTKAIATQGNNIYLNLKGRQKYGIVEPADKHELEEQIITDLYSYKHPISQKRVVAIALSNHDAALLGYGGPNCGDICYFIAADYARDHCDGLSTAQGACDTSLSPIFLAAGKGLKKGCQTKRVIRQVDVAPTLAILAGIRMPAQCEGAPIYQIFAESF